MKRIITAIFALSLISVANAAESSPQDPQVIALIKEIQTQQATIVSNQSKIDSRMADVAEALRVARIYSSRGGR